MATCPDCDGLGVIRDGDGDEDECAFCGGLGHVEIPEDDGWEAAVDRGIQAHRERFLE